MNNCQGQMPAPPQQHVEVDLDAYVATLVQQRNAAMDAVAQQAGVISRLQKQLKEAEEAVWKLQHPPVSEDLKLHE